MQQEQIDEWKENPVTEALKTAIEAHLVELRSISPEEYYHPFDAQKTQEVLATMNGTIDAWHIIFDALCGDWSFFELEGEVDEQQRH